MMEFFFGEVELVSVEPLKRTAVIFFVSFSGSPRKPVLWNSTEVSKIGAGIERKSVSAPVVNQTKSILIPACFKHNKRRKKWEINKVNKEYLKTIGICQENNMLLRCIRF